MTLHGLFLGIDRYASPDVNWLACAKRDAVALHALFTDTFGGRTVLLTDEEATKNEIISSLDALSKVHKDDLVVIAFSGHGSETHELIPYDSDPEDLENTAIPLDVLTELFSKIPSKNLICILDCCFSGGAGAKVLKVEAKPRAFASAENLLAQLSGEGRLIFTASAATEPAWETAQSGHGLLTYHLLHALQGAEEVRQSGKVSVLRLLDYVTQRVINDAARIKKEQHPAIRGTIDGELAWPIFKPGSLYAAAFPDRSRPTVTADIKTLAGYGFPENLIDVWAGSILSFNELQQSAINDFGLLLGENLLVSAPTSSGKTMIGELAALQGILERKRTIFLFPLKAIVNDKQKAFTTLYGPFGLRTIKATGDSTSDDIVPLMRGQYDICLMTYEKFASIALGNPFILEQVKTIVVDEVQMITDESRGVNVEFILTLLKMREAVGLKPQLIALSAVIGDTNGFERWLGARLLRRTERPVPLDEGIVRADGTFRYISSDTGEEKLVSHFVRPEFGKDSDQVLIKPLTKQLLSEGKRVIVFRETRGEARGCAKYLAAYLSLPPAQPVLDALPEGDPSSASIDLKQTLLQGVSFHISDLDPEERLLIEEEFRSNPTTLKVIAATTTLAMGINTPAEAVIISGLDHPDKPYSVAEYKNIVGRAGRLGFASRGASYLIARSPNDEHYFWNHYVRGVPEDLHSRFLNRDTDPRSIVLRILTGVESLSGSGGLTSEEICIFLEDSFGAFQQKQLTSGWSWNRSQTTGALASLVSHKLITADDKGKNHLTNLGRFAGQAGVEVESVVRLVAALVNNNSGGINDPTLIAATQLTVELDDLGFPINKKSTQKEPQTWFGEIQRQGIAQTVINAMRNATTKQNQATLRAKKTAACLLWITDMPINQIERIVTQFGGGFDGAAGPVKNLKSRTVDLLPTTARVAELLYPDLDLSERLDRLLIRLELGGPPEIVDLGRELGHRLTRGDYLRLIRTGLANVETVQAVDDDAILPCVDGDINKLSQVRSAITRVAMRNRTKIVSPILPEYRSQ